jgi:hypothetical protein
MEPGWNWRLDMPPGVTDTQLYEHLSLPKTSFVQFIGMAVLAEHAAGLNSFRSRPNYLNAFRSGAGTSPRSRR